VGGTTINSKPPGLISMMGQSEKAEQQSDPIYYTLCLWQVQNVAAPITSPQQLSPMMAEPKPFS